jgi:hypothetical protein
MGGDAVVAISSLPLIGGEHQGRIGPAWKLILFDAGGGQLGTYPMMILSYDLHHCRPRHSTHSDTASALRKAFALQAADPEGFEFSGIRDASTNQEIMDNTDFLKRVAGLPR